MTSPLVTFRGRGDFGVVGDVVTGREDNADRDDGGTANPLVVEGMAVARSSSFGVGCFMFWNGEEIVYCMLWYLLNC